MKILLLNENPMVSRLINLSAQKMSYEVTEATAYSDELGTYDMIIVDNDTEVDLKALKEKCNQLVFLAPRDKDYNVEAQILHKPFLPTDFLNLFGTKATNFDNSIAVEAIDESDSYKDLELNLDDLELNLDDLPDDNKTENELSLESLSLDEEEQALAKETQKNKEDKLEDLNLDESLNSNEDLNEEKNEILDEVQVENQSEIESEIEKDSVEKEIKTFDESEENLEQDSQETTAEEEIKESEENKEELKENIEDNQELKEDLADTALENQEEIAQISETKEEEKQDEISEEEAFSVEEQEKQIDFNDLPQDAEFLGQEKESSEEEDFLPFIEDEISKPKDEINDDLTAQEQIKEELAELAELDDAEDGSKVLEEFKDEPILNLNDEKLGISDQELVIPSLESNDFDSLKESEIQKALGEEVSQEETNDIGQNQEDLLDESSSVQTNETQMQKGDEIVNELSHSIAQTIASSIKDDTLKAALKGMNMNINIKISFEEDKN
ncbi:hypothetical protein [Campylobacter cuniculorum]|uniref:FIP-RBD domain-containing protein n=2 Tax=Campylobacter cuniculorum TaxID=374106 RepID=A0A1W6BYC3_9BACT|nr:hypothetical protein [Campylobacter cuniculorum]ARJ57087.1 hypothetical protein CCUN_1502 [Campylobacter cuniculorum DSM 23162 = LMG 24588]QOR04532.1 hypothetical protein A0071_00855 [Campylobacter cuniculorum]